MDEEKLCIPSKSTFHRCGKEFLGEGRSCNPELEELGIAPYQLCHPDVFSNYRIRADSGCESGCLAAGSEEENYLAKPPKDSGERTAMQNTTPPPATIKTIWSKQSAVLLINIVLDVEHKILKKELVVGKENDRTKWDYVAAFLHEASPPDAGKTPTNCQYKFWELKRNFKYWRKGATRKSEREEKEADIYSALKAYFETCPPVKKKTGGQTTELIFKKSRNEPERQPETENPPELIGAPLESVPFRLDGCKCESKDDSGGSLRRSIRRHSVGHPGTSNHASQLSESSPVNDPTVEAAEPIRRPRGRPKGKRKAIDPGNLDLTDAKEKGNNSKRIKQLVDKMARLTSYMKWKQTGDEEDSRRVRTAGVERRQNRSTRKLIGNANQAKADDSETQGGDDVEAALREDILSCWKELDKKRPSPEECQKYLLKKYAGEVYW